MQQAMNTGRHVATGDLLDRFADSPAGAGGNRAQPLR